jgi:hypothetical protein
MTATMPDRDTAGTVPAGEEPPPTGLHLVHEQDRSIRVRYADTELLRYVYQPWDPQLESPRPYLHPVRTLAGDVVSLYRPHDHYWHKGIAWSLSNVGPDNFWGGRTFVRGTGYTQLPNNGSMRHQGFDALDVRGGVLRLAQRLRWYSQDERPVIDEHRILAVRVFPDADAWQLTFVTTLENLGDAPVPLGSPTTEGRDNAGYSGLFWRGPRSFSGGRVLMADAEGADELMGRRGPWLAYVGRHDGHGRASTLVFRDDEANRPGGGAVRWFVRTDAYACVCPAPFFSEAYPLAPGAPLTLRYDVLVADGARNAAECAALAGRCADLDPGRTG